MNLVQSTDVFALGVGLDIGGGYLIARGLLVSPAAILRRSINDEHYFIPEETAAMISDRVDAQFGLIALAVGFGVQATGYAMSASGFQGVGGAHSPTLRAFLTVVVAMLGVGIVISVWRVAKWSLVRRLILVVARDPLTLGANYWLTVGGDGGGGAPASGARLERLGAMFGQGRDPGESIGAYAERVFGARDVSEVDPLATAFHPARLS